MTVELKQFACLCGARSEGIGPVPECWLCGSAMRQWGTRSADYAPFGSDWDAVAWVEAA